MFEISEDPTLETAKPSRASKSWIVEKQKLEHELESLKCAYTQQEVRHDIEVKALREELLAAKKETKPVQRLRKLVLKAEEVCSIILHSGTANVAELSFGELHVRFGAPKPERQPETPTPVGQSQPIPPPSLEATPSEKDAARIDQETTEILELLTKEQQMAELLLTDSAEYERQLAAGELEDAPRTNEDT